MFICCTVSPTAARTGLPTQRSHITHIPYSELFRLPTYTHTLILKTEAARCSETSENPLLRGANAPKMTITTHIFQNTLLYLSSDGKTLAVQTSIAWTQLNVCGLARARVLFCVQVRSQSLEDVPEARRKQGGEVVRTTSGRAEQSSVGLHEEVSRSYHHEPQLKSELAHCAQWHFRPEYGRIVGRFPTG